MRDKVKKAKTAESEDDEHDPLGGSHDATWRKGDKESCGSRYNPKMHQSLQSLLTQTQRTQVKMIKNQKL